MEKEYGIYLRNGKQEEIIGKLKAFTLDEAYIQASLMKSLPIAKFKKLFKIKKIN